MIFHRFTLGDCEDPEIYAAAPMWEWQKTEAGEWVMEHCRDPAYKVITKFDTYGYEVVIYGELSEEDATYYTLKYK